MADALLVLALLGVSYIGWRHHSYTTALLAGILPTYLLRFSLAGIPTNFLEVAIGIVVAAGALSPAVRHRWRAAAKNIPRPIALWTGLFVLTAIVSTVISPHPITSLGILKSWILIPAMYAFMIYSLDSRYSLLVTRYLIVSGTVMSLLGLSQLGTLTRIQGIYDVPNSLALFLAPLIILAIAVPRPSKLRLLAAVVMFLALLATQSIGGMLAVIVTSLIVAAHSKMHISRRAWLGIALLGAALTGTAIPKISYLIQPTSSAYVRLQLWSIASQLIAKHPLAGVGLGDFEPAYQQKLHEAFAAGASNLLPEFVFRDPHNWVFSFWLNTGLLGLIAFAGLHLWVFWKKRPWRAAHWALLTLLLFGLVDTIFWKNDLSVMQLTLVSLAITRTDLALAPRQD